MARAVSCAMLTGSVTLSSEQKGLMHARYRAVKSGLFLWGLLRCLLQATWVRV